MGALDSGNQSASGVYWSRPDLFIDGEKQTALATGLMLCSIVESVTGLYRCEITLGNWNPATTTEGFLYFDRTLLDFGKSLQVRFNNQVLFDGRIMALEGRYPQGAPAQIVVLAEDRLQDLRMTRRSRSFAQSSDSDVFQQIAGDHGLSAEVNVTGPTYETLNQLNQSDLAFMRERARLLGAELWVDDSTLYVKQRTDRGNASPLELTYSSRLREFTVIADLAGQRTSVLAQGWDVMSKTAISARADESVIANELDGDISGGSILSSDFGQRVEAMSHHVPFTTTDAQSQANALYRDYARRFVVGHGVADTDAALRVGEQVDLKGLGPLFSGKYYLSQIRHVFDGESGIRTEFTGERSGIGQA